MKKYCLRICFLLLAVAWMTMIFLFSAQHAEASSQNSSGVVEKLMEWLYPDLNSLPVEVQRTLTDGLTFMVRKGAHMAEYAVLAILLYGTASSWDLCRGTWQRALAALSGTIVYAATDEFHQRFVPGRSGELRDVLIDAIGALIGILVVLTIIGLVTRRKRKKNTSED